MNKFLLLSSLLLLGISNTAQAEKLYQWVDKQGITHFTREAPNPEQVGSKSQSSGPSQSLINQKQVYQKQRSGLEAKRRGTVNSQRRDQLDRQIKALDYNWYKDRDPEKAAKIKQELGRPQVRELPQENKQAEPDNMDKYKAFY